EDHRSADRLVRRTTELQAHAATDEAGFEHGPAPGGPVDRDWNRLRAEHRVPGNQGLTRSLVEDGVRAIPGGYFENRARPHVAQVNSSLDFGLHDVAVNTIVQVCVRLKQTRILDRRAHTAAFLQFSILPLSEFHFHR